MAFGVTAAMAAATLSAAPASAAPAPAAAALSCKMPQPGGSVLAGGPVVYDPASSYEELYGVATDGTLQQKIWVPPGFPNPGWSKWKDLGGDITNTPSAVYDAVNDTLDVFARGIDGGLYVRFWCPGHDWQPWQDLGGDITGSPAAIYDPLTHKVEVYTDNADGTVGEYSGDTLNGFTFTNLKGDITGTPYPVVDEATNYRELELYVRGTDGSLYQKVWSPSTNSWSPVWNPLQGSFTGSPAAAWDGKDLDVFTDNTDGTLGEKSFDPNAGWKDWANLNGSITGSPSPVYDGGHGPVNVFDLGVNGPLFVKSGDGTTFSGWTLLGGGDLTGDPAGIDDPANDNYLEAFALTTTGIVFHAYYDEDSDAWESGTLDTAGPGTSTVTLAWL